MARAYQESHVLDSLTTTVKTLQTSVTELSRRAGSTDEQLKKLTVSHEALAKKHSELETRVAAHAHNSAARSANALLAQNANPNHTPLYKLHDLVLNRPVKQFPKHERDIKTLGQTQVIQILQALDIPTLGLGASEKKALLRMQLGLPTVEAGSS